MKSLCSLVFLLALSASASAGSNDNDVDYLMSGCNNAINQELCSFSEKEFRADYKKAYKKNYQAQRNVAYCLIGGCNGAVVENKPFGCAWRAVIIASGSPRVDETDRFNYEAVCKATLMGAERTQFKAQAKEIFHKVYGKTLVFREDE